MSKMGIGSFFGGFAEGYQKGTKLNMEREKADRESQMFGLQKQQAELELQAKQRDKEFQDTLASRIKALNQEMAPGVSGEVIDAQGNSMGVQKFAQGQVPNGLQFRPGTETQTAELDPMERYTRIADVIVNTALEYNKADINQLAQVQSFREKANLKTAMEAGRHFLATGDQDGAKKILKKAGIKVGDDIQFGIQDGAFGPTIVGYSTGKDGKQEIRFDMFKDVILPNAGADAYVRMMGDFKKSEFEEGNKNSRLGRQLASDREIAGINRSAAGQFTYKNEVDGLKDTANKAIETIKSDFTKRQNFGAYEKAIYEASAMARDFLDAAYARGERTTYQAAWLRATQVVEGKTGLKLTEEKKK